MALQSWALPQLTKISPLDDESLRQILDYVISLDKTAAAEHLKGLLGDSPQAIEFITSFNARRQAPSATAPAGSLSGQYAHGEDPLAVPRAKAARKKPRNEFNKLPPVRRVEDTGSNAGGYIKRQEDDYMAASSRNTKPSHTPANNLALNEPIQISQNLSVASATNSQPSSRDLSRNSSPKPGPRPAGRLISEVKSSRDSSPSKAKTKVHLTGGVAMHGQSETLNDLDSAIRALEIQTNPSLAPNSKDDARRKCNCMAQRHPLLAAAPNCLHCGKIICVKEGLGPCTFCGQALLSSAEIQSMVRILREERGKERQEANNASHKRADVVSAPRPFSASKSLSSTPAIVASPTASDSETDRLSAAKHHRDKLLAFQAQNARRTRIHDEAADFETTDAGLNIWASPAERALQLKKQQKVMRQQEWFAKPEWERRKVVASIDLVRGKVVRRMQEIERPASPDSEDDDNYAEPVHGSNSKGTSAVGGAFSQNPLLGGGLIRPVARVEEDGGKGKAKATERSTWRRVQDDNDDNEQWILDGGLMGASLGGMTEKSQEP